jgi:hypothetical protein
MGDNHVLLSDIQITRLSQNNSSWNDQSFIMLYSFLIRHISKPIHSFIILKAFFLV